MQTRASPASRLGLVLSLLALVFVSGSQWTLLQGVAWARMIVVYAEEGTLGEAIAQTFSGRRPCALCHQAQKGQHDDGEKAPWQRPGSTLELLPLDAALKAGPPSPVLAWIAVAPDDHRRGPCFPPPKPPPRCG
ncbi:MAG: hypothetical protein IPM17_14395 [Verrucomicrobia bacterium]|jgi:hypothetical protein|nr:hypothetical protein [Verrucomicrobiota bacterium]